MGPIQGLLGGNEGNANSIILPLISIIDLLTSILSMTVFAGVNCELDVSMCNASGDGPKKCLNGGRCLEGVGATFSCECQDGELPSQNFKQSSNKDHKILKKFPKIA